MARLTDNGIVLTVFFIAILTATFSLLFEENLDMPAVAKVLNLVDEVFVLLLFVFTFFFKRKANNRFMFFFMVLFVLFGAVSNYIKGSSFYIFALGCYNTIKPLLLFWSFCQYDFSWHDFFSVIRKLCYLFPIIVVSYIVDLIYPDFRRVFGMTGQMYDYRMGLRALGGLFNRFTNGTLFALIYFLVFRFYRHFAYKVSSARFRMFFSVFVIFASLKVKDVMGFILAFLFKSFKKFKSRYIFIICAVFVVLFNVYAEMMPKHYQEYFNVSEDSNIARVALTITSVKIAKDYFPFGVGFGMFASPTSQHHHSKIYTEYGIDHVYGLSLKNDNGIFMTDTFWPMILGETGVLGTIAYVLVLLVSFGPFIKKFFENTSDRRYLFPAFMFIAFCMMSIAKPVFSGPPHSLVLWGFSGIFYSISKKDYPYQV